MATPRVFVSSTCYDLQEIRHNLRGFIMEFSYEPVMSEYGDIFYEYEAHIQDSCLKEISKCQLFILIVGNNYGTLYHKQHSAKDIPDSVTLQEFKKSLSLKIPKHVFINRFVHYDYKNYRRTLENRMQEYFNSTEVPDKEIEVHKNKIRKEFDSSYPFPQKSYKYIFYFLDIIVDLKVNNAIFDFETFEDIKIQLKKQWAGYLYEMLTLEKSSITEEQTQLTLKDINNRVTSIEKILQELLVNSSGSNGMLSFDIEKFTNDFAYKDLEKAKDMLDQLIYNILHEESTYYLRGWILEQVEFPAIEQWLNSLDELIKKFKWAKTIPFSLVFENFKTKCYREHADIDFTTILKLYTLYQNISPEDKFSFINSVLLKLKEAVAENPFESEDIYIGPDDVPF